MIIKTEAINYQFIIFSNKSVNLNKYDKMMMGKFSADELIGGKY
jgi:hypothetical protein